MKHTIMAVFVLISIISNPVFAVPINDPINEATNFATGQFGTITVTKSAPVFSVDKGDDVVYSYVIERIGGAGNLFYSWLDDVVTGVSGFSTFTPTVNKNEFNSLPYAVMNTVTNTFTVTVPSEGDLEIPVKLTVEVNGPGGSVPEPSTLALLLLGLGLATIGFGRRIVA